MQHYDLRVIEDCLVFSYEVACPNYPKPAKSEAVKPVRKPPAHDTEKKRTSRSARKRAIMWTRTKKLLLRFLFLVLFPFVMAADLVFRAMTLALGVCRRRPAYITTFITVSFFAIISTVIGIL